MQMIGRVRKSSFISEGGRGGVKMTGLPSEEVGWIATVSSKSFFRAELIDECALAKIVAL